MFSGCYSRVCCLATLLFGVLGGRLPAGATNTSHAVTAEALPALWFPVGEELVYRIKWGVFAVGSSRISTEWIVYDGKPVLAIHYRTRTNRLFSKIYPMDDLGETLVDPETFLPLRFAFRRKRRRTACDDVVTFDYERGSARIESACKGWVKDAPITREIRDVMSFMYWLRRTPLQPGADESYHIMGNDGVADLRIRVGKETEVLDLPVFGKTECLVLRPELDLADLLVEAGRLTMWVANDSRRMAPLLLVRAPVANVRATLCRVNGPFQDKWTEISRRQDGDTECVNSDGTSSPSPVAAGAKE
jgi:hypothetical protein